MHSKTANEKEPFVGQLFPTCWGEGGQTYVPKTKRPLEEVGERQQRRWISNFMESSKAAAETKMFAFRLNEE